MGLVAGDQFGQLVFYQTVGRLEQVAGVPHPAQTTIRFAINLPLSHRTYWHVHLVPKEISVNIAQPLVLPSPLT